MSHSSNRIIWAIVSRENGVVRCDSTPSFSEVTFRKHTSFEGTTFKADVTMDGAVFKNDSSFRRATLGGFASFEGTRFCGPPLFDAIVLKQGTASVSGLDETVREFLLEAT